MGKSTIPPKFGLIPKVITHSVPNLCGDPGTRKAIEFIHGTPMESLEGWIPGGLPTRPVQGARDVSPTAIMVRAAAIL